MLGLRPILFSIVCVCMLCYVCVPPMLLCSSFLLSFVITCLFDVLCESCVVFFFLMWVMCIFVLHSCMFAWILCVWVRFFFFFCKPCVVVWVMYDYLCLWRQCSFLSGLFVFGHKLLGWVVPLDVNCSFLSSLFVFGCKLLSRVLPLGVNFSFLSGLFVFGRKLLASSGPPTLGRVLKTRKHPKFSYGTFLVLLACMCVIKVESLKVENISVFFLSKVLPYLHVCLHICVCSV